MELMGITSSEAIASMLVAFASRLEPNTAVLSLLQSFLVKFVKQYRATLGGVVQHVHWDV